jgi:hypothetical protein
MAIDWMHAAIGGAGVVIGAITSIFTAGWRLGRIESRMKLNFQEAIAMSEKRIEDRVEAARGSFDETLKGLRQKINDVELNSERRFLPKEEFNDFREEYRENTNRIFDKLDQITRQ